MRDFRKFTNPTRKKNRDLVELKKYHKDLFLVGNATRRKMSPEKSLDFLSQKSVLRPPVAGPSAETHPSRRQARVRKRTSPVDKSIGRSRVLGVPAELALLHPIENAWHDLGFPCHGCRWKRRVAPFGAACQMEGLERRRR